ncbi:DNA/RNA polymerases superfamily protein [Gossypium australe]|uniref:DNA/RNA polymerases superfamily protein n=1 Tax=Gossypium australe TaxID=47621 RepID=A0A5B6VNA4_9ROSI|nr:DNA/RNA polymerases superfamily protein [Gossypium australe]
MHLGKVEHFSIGKEGKLRLKNRMFVLVGNELRKKLVREAHQGPFSLHPAGINIMKNDISEYVSTCLPWQKVKAEHQVSLGNLYLLEILE